VHAAHHRGGALLKRRIKSDARIKGLGACTDACRMTVPFPRAAVRLLGVRSGGAALLLALVSRALPSRNRAWRRVTLMLLGIAVAAGFAAPSALAAPNITLAKEAPPEILFGEDSQVTLHAANPDGQPYGYNLSFRDVLPAGVSYVPGSAPVEPRVIPNAPAAGQTTLIFENVSDLSPGSTYSLGYQVRHDTGVLGVGDSYTNQAGAYINDDPRFVPDFGPNGAPTGDFTGSATDSATTLINAIEIEKDEPSPEGELLRGVHDHQTVYTLTVRNNAVEPTTGIDVEDWLPAGLEYLGCGTEDNTTDAPTNPAASPDEYAGSGALNPGNAPTTTDCVVPDLVETVSTDPDGAGPLPTAVYTHVVWNDVGTASPGSPIRIQYVAGVPLRENTTTWTGAFPPTPASLDQGSNLDNNSGPETPLTKTASTDRPRLGKPLSYELVVRNVGDSPATDVRLVDTLSKAVKFKQVTTSVGTCPHKGGQVTCELGTLAPGAQATVVVTVITKAAGALRNAASVTAGNGADLVPADNGAVADVNVTAPKARWKLAKRASRRAVRGGKSVRFAITVRARGRAVAGAKVCDPLPDGLVFMRARGATFRNGRACWKLGYLAPNSKHTVHVVTRAERGFSIRNVRNVAVARASNAARRTDGARVRVKPAFGGDDGGVTG
jgi:uncharacterized repeat protein (TIGR01451 family)